MSVGTSASPLGGREGVTWPGGEPRFAASPPTWGARVPGLRRWASTRWGAQPLHSPSRGEEMDKSPPRGTCPKEGNYPNLISYDSGIILKKERKGEGGSHPSTHKVLDCASYRAPTWPNSGSWLARDLGVHSSTNLKMVRVLLTELLDVSERETAFPSFASSQPYGLFFTTCLTYLHHLATNSLGWPHHFPIES